ncbi:hypothetical protein E7X19_23920 [Bacteroides fragilis]|nr:hypothetical protein E7X19_23920 [Bacteroides fragilis]
MFQKGEAEVKILKRTFYTDKPFKIELDADKKLHTAFYGPVNLHDVKVMCRMKAYSNEFFPIAYYEEYPAFYETWMELPVITKETTFRTESGKSLTIPAQPELLAKDCEFKIVNNDKYMQNIGKIKNPIKIIFITTNLPEFRVNSKHLFLLDMGVWHVYWQLTYQLFSIRKNLKTE